MVFFSQETPASTKSEPMSDYQFVAWTSIIGGGLGWMWFDKHEYLIKNWLFNNTAALGMTAYCIFAVLCFLVWRRISKKLGTFLKRGQLIVGLPAQKGAITVGYTLDGAKIALPQSIRTGHVQIIGSTGRGKTESVILPWLLRDLEQKCSVVLMDGKGDKELAKLVQSFLPVIKTSVKYLVFDLGNPQHSATTNPLESGSAQQITDRIFKSFEFDQQYYKAVQSDFTGMIVELLHDLGETVTFRRLHQLLTDDQKLTEALSKTKNSGLKRRGVLKLGEPKKDREKNLAGIVSQLAPLATGEIACLVNGPVKDKEYFSLSKLLIASKEEQKESLGCEAYALIILLPALLYQESAFKLGKLFLQETAWAVASRTEKAFTPIYLDEFSCFVYDGFINILNKARSSQIALHLSHQSIADLSAVSPDFAMAVNANTNVKCLLGLNDPETADFFAKHLGTYQDEKVTERATKDLFNQVERSGDLSIRSVETYRVHPNKLKNYTRGQGVIQFSTPNGTVTEEVQFDPLPKVAGQ